MRRTASLILFNVLHMYSFFHSRYVCTYAVHIVDVRGFKQMKIKEKN